MSAYNQCPAFIIVAHLISSYLIALYSESIKKVQSYDQLTIFLGVQRQYRITLLFIAGSSMKIDSEFSTLTQQCGERNTASHFDHIGKEVAVLL